MKIIKSPLHMFANPAAVISQFLELPGENRVLNIIERVMNLSERQAEVLYKKILNDFGKRHRDIERIFQANADRIYDAYKDRLQFISSKRKNLLGSFFTKEYSIQAAALFNPSIVWHPDQEGLHPGERRFIMSLRATGEGHISSVTFQTGIINLAGQLKLDPGSGYYSSLQKNEQAIFQKKIIQRAIGDSKEIVCKLIENLPDSFVAKDALKIIRESPASPTETNCLEKLSEIFDSNYELESSAHLSLNEKVIFPSAKAESMGMEDARFVRFEDDDDYTYYGTYTAYDGKRIRSQLIETKDFDVFRIRTLYGNAISDKGMALFPEKVNGKYVMISRQGGEKINIMFSDDLYRWNEYKTLLEPVYDWEIVQLGNCGSPIKTERGWLLLIHGVGALRTYVISAVVLDLNDPSKVIARLENPLLEADEKERNGYVPNVVYTCGMLKNRDLLFMPYAISDSSIGFAHFSINELLNEMKWV